MKNTGLYVKGFPGLLCFVSTNVSMDGFTSPRKASVAGIEGGLHTYTLQMVSFYKRWSCIWWSWLNIKTPPSAIYSNGEGFGQTLTSLEMIHSFLTREDAQSRPAARHQTFWFTAQGSGLTLWSGCSRWTDSTLIMRSREFLSTLTVFSWPFSSWKNILSTCWILLSAFTPALGHLEEPILILVLKTFRCSLYALLLGIELVSLSGL